MPATELKAGNEREPFPGDLVAPDYRPADSIEHYVKDGENWMSLAARYGVSAKFIIYSNFKTYDPAEINWYLHHYVKCNKMTADRYNWRFSTSARSMDDPRSGVIYIVPNWFQIGVQARILTRDFVWRFLKTVSLDSSEIESTHLIIQQNAVHSSTTSAYGFIELLKNAGAPDELATRWGAVLLHALQVFVSRISGYAVDVFPQLLNIQAGYPFENAMAKPFHLLEIALDDVDEIVNEIFFRQILITSHIKGTAASIAMRSYGKWFEESFAKLRKTAVTSNVIGGGKSDHMGIFRGRAAGFQGFLEKVEMP